ncbi:MAG TPA: ankyrin repeat domain-containing protein [Candidatus Babeliaceae bacterium]|nr:ankyrin repeat domain-containing protein [Candidatus Babeliaceae bacterium]
MKIQAFMLGFCSLIGLIGITYGVSEKNQNYAITKDSPEAIEGLVTDDGTLSYKAIIESPLSVIKDLIDKGVSVNNDDYYQNPLILAIGWVRPDQLDLIKLLISAGAKINTQFEDDETALAAAIIHNDKDIVSLLLEMGADPNLSIFPGVKRPPLAMAVDRLIPAATIVYTYGPDDTLILLPNHDIDPDIIELLLDYGARVNDEDKEGQTALDILLNWTENVDKNKKEKVYNMLKKHGALRSTDKESYKVASYIGAVAAGLGVPALAYKYRDYLSGWYLPQP